MNPKNSSRRHKNPYNDAVTALAWQRHRINVVRIEMDYELMTLFDAIKADDLNQIVRSKIKLQQFRRELITLGEFK